jgi:hypothetical protein
MYGAISCNVWAGWMSGMLARVEKRALTLKLYCSPADKWCRLGRRNERYVTHTP